MSWASDMPAELLVRPVGLIVLTGLDLVYNAVHKAIWDSFSNNRRSDRVPLQFIAHGVDHEYPKCRAKRSSYEWYIPKGILKSSWMSKHLTQVPAVVVIFFDLDWDEAMWKERQMECATRIEIVRNSLLGRGGKVCMVLIQKNAPLPPGEDVIAAERAASLCSACELSAKSLFVLPLTDHLLGYVIRLENAFFESSQAYYHTEARRVKSHRDFLNKTTHQLLFVRHQFKIAFFNELKQDPHTALKHYKQAYSHVLELRMLDANLLEVKTVAGFINYKICRLSFQVNTPLDSIAQFRKHIDFFKSKTGIADLSFEHSSWMAKQFQLFGDLFDEAVKLGGLTAIQTQHPGFYYQQSANHSLARKQLASKLNLDMTRPVNTDVLESLNTLDYYGQRPWRQGHQSIEPPDLAKEKEGILALQFLESKVDHSWIIIPLLGNAVAQFKKYKSPRMKRYLMVQMGEEYYYANDCVRALALLTRVTWEYRQERWWALLTSVLVTQLKCAYLNASLAEYLTAGLELIGKYTDNTSSDKLRIYTNMLAVLNGSVPSAEPGCASDTALSLWSSLSTGDENLVIDVTNLAAFIECKATFTSDTFTADKAVGVEVHLRSTCPASVDLSALNVSMSNPKYSQVCRVPSADAGSDEKIHLEPNEIRRYEFCFICDVEDVGKLIEIKSVAIEWSGLDPVSKRTVCLQWNGSGGDGNKHDVVDKQLPWHEIVVRPQAKLLQRPAVGLDIDVQHCPPAFVNERYEYSVTVTNNEPTAIADVSIKFGFKDTTGNIVTRMSHATGSSSSSGLSSSAVTSDSSTVITTDDSAANASQDGGVTLQSNEQLKRSFYSETSVRSDLMLVVAVAYDITVAVNSSTVQCHCQKEQNICLSVLEPLAFDFQFRSLQYDQVETVICDEPFLLLTDIRSLACCPLKLLSSRLTWLEKSDTQPSKNACTSFISNVKLANAVDHAGECYVLTASQSHLQSADSNTLPLGRYVVTLQRDGEIADRSFSFSVDIPAINVVSLPVVIHCQLPTVDVRVESVVMLTYCLCNNTNKLHDVDVNIESSEAFMFAGNRQVRVRVLPNSVHQLNYNVVPLVAGNVNLPKLRINLPLLPVDMETYSVALHRMLPTSIFVQPRSCVSS